MAMPSLDPNKVTMKHEVSFSLPDTPKDSYEMTFDTSCPDMDTITSALLCLFPNVTELNIIKIG